MKSSAILGRAIAYGAILTVSIAVVGSIVGYLVADTSGLISALTGAGLTALFMALTAGTIVIASRATGGDSSSTIFFAIVLGAWLIKFVLFIAILVVLRGQPFLEPVVFFFSILAAVLGSLIVDVLAFVRARESYVPGVQLPGEDTSTSN
ncbi:ATP synthase subunit I [Salinibacterium sp. NYA9b]